MEQITPYEPLTELVYDYSVNYKPAYKKIMPTTPYTNKTGVKPIFRKMFNLNIEPSNAIVDYKNYRKMLRERIVSEKTRLIQGELEDELNDEAELYQLRKEQERIKAFQLQFQNTLLSVVADQVLSFQRREALEQAIKEDNDLNQFDEQTINNLQRLQNIRKQEETAQQQIKTTRDVLTQANQSLIDEAQQTELSQERLDELMSVKADLEQSELELTDLESSLSSIISEEEEAEVEYLSDDDEEEEISKQQQKIEELQQRTQELRQRRHFKVVEQFTEEGRSRRTGMPKMQTQGGFEEAVEREQPLEFRRGEEPKPQEEPKSEWEKVKQETRIGLNRLSDEELTKVIRSVAQSRKINVSTKKQNLLTPKKQQLVRGKREEAIDFLMTNFKMSEQRLITQFLQPTTQSIREGGVKED